MNSDNTIQRLKEIIQTFEANMQKVRSAGVLDRDTRIWVRTLRNNFEKEVIDLVKRL